MTTLQFADTHNLVAFLAKPTESEGFEQVVKTVNKEQQLQALVDGNKIVVTEASVRRDLQLDEEEGTNSCIMLPFLKTYKNGTTAWNEFSSAMASAIICLDTNQKFNFSKYIFESMVKNLDNAGKFLMYPSIVKGHGVMTCSAIWSPYPILNQVAQYAVVPVAKIFDFQAVYVPQPLLFNKIRVRNLHPSAFIIPDLLICLG
ncbi:hypothetical protein Tco_0685005 [Tanacetum coccineum]